MEQSEQSYTAVFDIEHGIHNGTYKRPGVSQEHEEILASKPIDALCKAEARAEYWAKEYLTDHTGLTQVTLTLCDAVGKVLDQSDIVRQEYTDRDLQNKELLEKVLQKFKNGRLVIERTWIENVLELS